MSAEGGKGWREVGGLRERNAGERWGGGGRGGRMKVELHLVPLAP